MTRVDGSKVHAAAERSFVDMQIREDTDIKQPPFTGKNGEVT